MPTIRVSRNDLNGRFRSMRIDIDGNRAMALGDFDEASVEVSAGIHRVRAKMDWAASRTVEVHLSDGESAHLEARLPLDVWSIFTRPRTSVHLDLR